MTICWIKSIKPTIICWDANQTFYLEIVITGLILDFARTSMLASCRQTVLNHAIFALHARFLFQKFKKWIYVNIYFILSYKKYEFFSIKDFPIIDNLTFLPDISMQTFYSNLLYQISLHRLILHFIKVYYIYVMILLCQNQLYQVELNSYISVDKPTEATQIEVLEVWTLKRMSTPGR